MHGPAPRQRLSQTHRDRGCRPIAICGVRVVKRYGEPGVVDAIDSSCHWGDQELKGTETVVRTLVANSIELLHQRKVVEVASENDSVSFVKSSHLPLRGMYHRRQSHRWHHRILCPATEQSLWRAPIAA